jgi:hypothetical protein
MNNRLITMFAAVGLCAMAGTAGATVFYIDEFTVTEDGATYWRDTFSNGQEPNDRPSENPAVVDDNLYNLAYLTRPQPKLPGPEEDGKLALDTDDGLLNIGVVNPVPTKTLRARVNSSTDITQDSALTEDEAITVSGRFDLIEPQRTNELYSIRLTDWAQGSRQEGVELLVGKPATGEWLVALRQAEIGVGWDIIQSWVLVTTTSPGPNEIDVTGFDQILLSLSNDPANGNGGKFIANFTLSDTDGSLLDQTVTSSAPGLMFEKSGWLRPEFTARRQVPEPSVLALLALGIAGMGMRRRTPINPA